MADKVSKIYILLQTLSRIPGLGFLANADAELRSTVDYVEEYGDTAEEIQRNAQDATDAAKGLASRDDDE